MALSLSVLSCLLLASMLNLASGQTSLPESVFKVLTAAELRDINLRQNPELLEFAARTGETVRVDITTASQGAIVQEAVTTILDCGPWLRNFPGGSVRWFRYRYRDLDHTELDSGIEQIPEVINAFTNQRANITGDFNEIYTIIRGLISVDAEDASRGVYECQVCIGRGTEFEICHSANTTVANVGRPPIIDVGVGREPLEGSNDLLLTYNIGSTICLLVDPVDPSRNRPIQIARLRCADVGEINEENIPTPLPAATVTWEHTDLEGNSAFFAINRAPDEIDDVTYTPPDEFSMTFPGLVAQDSPFTVSTDAGMSASSIDFSLNNITRNFTNTNYLNLRMAFGRWTCTLNNSLGSQTEETFISDSCGDAIPSIFRNCDGIGEFIPAGGVYLLDLKSSAPVRAGCDVCLPSGSSLALTLTCPTNIANFPNDAVTGYRWTDGAGNVLSEASFLTVTKTGMYTCTAMFGDTGSDSATSSISFAPDVDIKAVRSRDSIPFDTLGCERLRSDDPAVESGDVCAFFDTQSGINEGEDVTITCEAGQENVTAAPSIMGFPIFDGTIRASTGTDGTRVACDVSNTPDGINQNCAAAVGLTVHTYEPARIVRGLVDTCGGRYAGFSQTAYFLSNPTIVTVCCEALGYPDPEVQWYRLRTGPGGITFEDPIGNGTTEYNVDTASYTLTIPNYVASRDDGTYVCRAENIAGIDVASAALTTTETTYRWAVGEWCECEPACTNGTRSRKVWCETVPEGIVVGEAFCDCLQKPDEEESCLNVPGLYSCGNLIPLWKTGNFSRCSKGCAGGVRYRPVYCAIPLNGTRVDDNRCVEIYGPLQTPSSYDICFNTCCFTDTYPEYCRYTGLGPCSNPIYQQHCCWTCGLSHRG